MRFIIEREIYFRPADGAIWHIGSEQEKRFLTPASSRLFAYLIEQQGQVLSRNDIFQAVWENYGLHSSNNTLNQYISLLRRTLADFGLEAQIIKTIPKAGFLLSPDVTIAREAAPFSLSAKRERSQAIRDVVIILLTIALLGLLAGVGLNNTKNAALSGVAKQSVENVSARWQYRLSADSPTLDCPA
ncbi:winged helix-turn-helix domain-containing protein [Vagococcus sp. WN89Y]|uniref:winged helix-turn-helix domain-containing protein n=1 Tax=Vagococcus sp. WN89Y TaxID=3457258 RepID=UPI003FCD347C